MIKIALLTATRAEYGLMRPLIDRMNQDSEIDLQLVVTGTHLAEQYGMTIREIENDGNKIAEKIPVLSEKEGALALSETMANALVKFTEYFQRNKPDFLMVDGDRYETLAVCVAAVNSNVPIIHLYGGATTEGAADECYRHAITKMSYLHFTSMDVYRNRIIQMGESPERVFAVGSLGIENIRKTKLLSKDALENELGFKLDLPYCVITFHPVTLEKNTAQEQVRQLLLACDRMPEYKFIFTKANADCDGNIINNMLETYAEKHTARAICVSSLGAVRYLSALRYCSFVMGNSSSGLIEAPSFGIPTINIGNRQKGRVQADSVLNCTPESNEILKCVRQAEEKRFREKCKTVINPNGDGYTSERIVQSLKDYLKNNRVNIEKKFYDLKVDTNLVE